MDTLVYKLPRLPLAAAGTVAVLLSGIAIAALALSAQGFNGAPAPDAPAVADAVPAPAAPAVRARRCAECGVIESTREITAPDAGTAATPPRNYEITIRMQDGTMRVIHDAKPAQWRRGEPVTVIAGVD
jgi:hypothetical protein